MGDQGFDVEDAIYRDLGELAERKGLKDPRPPFGSTRVVQRELLPGTYEQQAAIYSALIYRNLLLVDREKNLEALYVKFNLLDGYPDSGSMERLAALGDKYGRKIERLKNGEKRNRQSENLASAAQKQLASLIYEEITRRNELDEWDDLLAAAQGIATKNELYRQRTVRGFPQVFDGDREAPRSDSPRWAYIDLELVGKQGQGSYRRLIYQAGSYALQHYIEHGLERGLTKREQSIAVRVIERASEERTPYRELLERLGRELGLDTVAMSTARVHFSENEPLELQRYAEESLKIRYGDQVPPGAKIRIGIMPIEDCLHSYNDPLS